MPVIPREGLLREVKERLRKILGDDLVEVILFGSHARGEAEKDGGVVVRRRLTLEEYDRLSEITGEYATGERVSCLAHRLSYQSGNEARPADSERLRGGYQSMNKYEKMLKKIYESLKALKTVLEREVYDLALSAYLSSKGFLEG